MYCPAKYANDPYGSGLKSNAEFLEMKNPDQHFRNLVTIGATRNINNGEEILDEYGDEYGFH